MKYSTNAPCWFDLMATDQEAAMGFYAKLFGWTYDTSGPEFGHYAICKVGDLSAAGMGRRPANAPYPTVWTLYFNVEDCDATAAAIKARGGIVTMGPITVGEQGRMAIAVDPTGAAFGLWQPLRRLGADLKDKHGSMGWQEAHVPDGPAARDFYGAVFGFDPEKVPEMDYWLMKRSDAPRELCGVMTDKDNAPHWLLYFDVEDIQAAVDTLETSGGKTHQPPFDTPHGRMAIVADPWGASFAMIQPPTS